MTDPQRLAKERKRYIAAWEQLRFRYLDTLGKLIVVYLFSLALGFQIFFVVFVNSWLAKPPTFSTLEMYSWRLLLATLVCVFLLLPIIPLWGARLGLCHFPCPRCHRRFFGWKPRRRFLRPRAWAMYWRRFRRGPRRYDPREHGRACRYCGLPLRAKAEDAQQDDALPSFLTGEMNS